MTRIMHRAGIGVTHGAGDGLSEFPSDLADAGTAGSAAAFSVQTSDASALVTLASSIRGSDAPALCMRVLVAVSVTAWAGASTAAGTARRAHVRHPSCRFSRLQKEIAGRDDAERKKAIHRRSRFFRTHELTGADCPIQKAAPRTPSGYVTKIGTEPQVAPFRAAILRGSAADLVHLEFQRGHGVRNRGGVVARRLLEPPIPLPVANGRSACSGVSAGTVFPCRSRKCRRFHTQELTMME